MSVIWIGIRRGTLDGQPHSFAEEAAASLAGGVRCPGGGAGGVAAAGRAAGAGRVDARRGGGVLHDVRRRAGGEAAAARRGRPRVRLHHRRVGLPRRPLARAPPPSRRRALLDGAPRRARCRPPRRGRVPRRWHPPRRRRRWHGDDPAQAVRAGAQRDAARGDRAPPRRRRAQVPGDRRGDVLAERRAERRGLLTGAPVGRPSPRRRGHPTKASEKARRVCCRPHRRLPAKTPRRRPRQGEEWYHRRPPRAARNRSRPLHRQCRQRHRLGAAHRRDRHVGADNRVGDGAVADAPGGDEEGKGRDRCQRRHDAAGGGGRHSEPPLPTVCRQGDPPAPTCWPGHPGARNHGGLHGRWLPCPTWHDDPRERVGDSP